MKSRVVCPLLRLGFLALALLLVLPAYLSANDTVYFTSVPNTDFAVFGAGGMRGQGFGNPGIVVTGVSGTVTAAYLFWQGPGAGNDDNASVTFNGTPITGVNIGNSSDNCWGFADSRAYRANVTALVTGNATYTLTNFTKPSGDDINGVSLVVFFDDGNPANNRDVVIFNGNDSNQPNIYDADGWNATLSGINYTSGTVNALFIVADGQNFPDEALVINGVTILPSGQNWDGNTVPDQGTAGNTNGGLWDQKSLDLTSLFVPGPNTLVIQPQTPVSDCLSLIAVLFDLPQGAAPPTPTPPGPTVTPGGPTPTPTPPIGPTAVVPTLSGRMLAVLGLALALIAFLVLRRQA